MILICVTLHMVLNWNIMSCGYIQYLCDSQWGSLGDSDVLLYARSLARHLETCEVTEKTL